MNRSFKKWIKTSALKVPILLMGIASGLFFGGLLMDRLYEFLDRDEVAKLHPCAVRPENCSLMADVVQKHIDELSAINQRLSDSEFTATYKNVLLGVAEQDVAFALRLADYLAVGRDASRRGDGDGASLEVAMTTGVKQTGVMSVPPGATISVNGIPHGLTNNLIGLKSSSLDKLRVHLAGYHDCTYANATVQHYDAMTMIECNLEAIAPDTP